MTSLIKILVVEDQPSQAIYSRKLGDDEEIEKKSRSDLYNELATRSFRGATFEILPVFNADQFLEVSDDHFDLVISDINLTLNGFADALNGLTEVLDKLRGRLPVILVSNQWEQVVDENMTNFKRREVIALWDIRRLAVAAFDNGGMTSINRYLSQIYEVASAQAFSSNVSNDFPNIDDNETIHIIHMSDPQYGGASAEDHEWETEALARQISEKVGKDNVHFLVVSGDIAERGWPAEYDQAQKSLSKFVKDLSKGTWELPSKRILLCPGNHDFFWELAKGIKATEEKDIADRSKQTSSNQTTPIAFSEHDRESFEALAWQSFWDFARKISNREYGPKTGRQHLIDEFRHLGLDFYCFNTTTNIWDPDGYLPQIREADIARSLEEFEASEADAKKTLFSIGILHHPLKNDQIDHQKHRKEVIKNFDKVSKRIIADQFPIKLAMCGHLHKHSATCVTVDDKRRILQSQSSTLTKSGDARFEDSLRGLNLISLNRDCKEITRVDVTSYKIEDGTATDTTKSFTWDNVRGEWTSA